MPKRILKCSKCKQPLDLDIEICTNCGKILDIKNAKTNMLSRSYLKKMKEV